MYTSKSFVYLDLQKTGTNFIVDFLRRFNSEEGAERRKHKPVREQFNPDKIYFISVRDPLDQYISLYSFGCDGEGNLYKRLMRNGRTDLYSRSPSAFRHWLEFVLNPANAMSVDPRYANAGDGRIPELIGLQSFRFLNLAFSDPAVAFVGCRTKQDLLHAYRTKNIISVTIRYSHFIEDLKTLVQNNLAAAISDVAGALAFLESAPPLNSSDRVDKSSDLKIDQPARDLLREREWLYYGMVPT